MSNTPSVRLTSVEEKIASSTVSLAVENTDDNPLDAIGKELVKLEALEAKAAAEAAAKAKNNAESAELEEVSPKSSDNVS